MLRIRAHTVRVPWAMLVSALAGALVLAYGTTAAEGANSRAYELVSPPDKSGGAIIGNATRTRAAADGSAVMFGSLTPFGDVLGTGVATEYVGVRRTSPLPGSNGWATHSITPLQDKETFTTVVLRGEPRYQGMFSADLTQGVFRGWSAVTSDPIVQDVINLYVRRDLRTPGAGFYQLLTACPLCGTTPLSSLLRANSQARPEFAGASSDFDHLIFETGLNLVAPASGGTNFRKLYEATGGTLRLVGMLPDGSPASRSLAGRGVSVGGNPSPSLVSRPISADGSRITFTVPPSASSFSGQLYTRINGRSTVQLNASERTAPVGPEDATYWDASTDGSRVFFTSLESLTDDAPTDSAPKLYMWAKSQNDEEQSVAVSATGGTFSLSFNGQATEAIPFNAPALAVESELAALPSVGNGNVVVSGGPGDVGGSAPYVVRFTGDFAGANVAELSADGTGLSGGTGASVAISRAVRNLSFLNADLETGGGSDTINEVGGVFGASADGRRVYFAALGQLVPGERLLGASSGIYAWHDGVVEYIGECASINFDAQQLFDGTALPLARNQTRVSADGDQLLFRVRSGDGLLSEYGGSDYDHAGFFQFYVYDADTRRLACASCNPSGAPATANADGVIQAVAGGTIFESYRNRPLSSDGRYVFFNTREALVPDDVNSRIDAYEYDVLSGRQRLLSTGTHPSDSYFLDASANGDDVFFITREQLVGWDRDLAYDLYDARVGGGFPEPSPPAPGCDGAACQGALSAGPDAQGAGTVTYHGSGNVRSARPRRARRGRRRARACPRGKVKQRVRGRVRCVRRSSRRTRSANKRRAK